MKEDTNERAEAWSDSERFISPPRRRGMDDGLLMRSPLGQAASRDAAESMREAHSNLVEAGRPQRMASRFLLLVNSVIEANVNGIVRTDVDRRLTV
jgi:hypothetical protein